MFPSVDTPSHSPQSNRKLSVFERAISPENQMRSPQWMKSARASRKPSLPCIPDELTIADDADYSADVLPMGIPCDSNGTSMGNWVSFSVFLSLYLESMWLFACLHVVIRALLMWQFYWCEECSFDHFTSFAIHQLQVQLEHVTVRTISAAHHINTRTSQISYSIPTFRRVCLNADRQGVKATPAIPCPCPPFPRRDTAPPVCPPIR